MTESQWLVSEDPAQMLVYWTNVGAVGVSVADLGRCLASDRKLRLFACACCLLCEDKSRQKAADRVGGPEKNRG